MSIARARVRAATMAAESRLHDLGVIHMTSSDAQGMGRAGETWWCTFALAGVVAAADPGRQERMASDDDNDRILRYLAKITVNPALVLGIAHEVVERDLKPQPTQPLEVEAGIDRRAHVAAEVALPQAGDLEAGARGHRRWPAGP